jgi:ComEC/Rec2-related protein
MKLWAPQPRQPFIGLALAAVLGIIVADRWAAPPWIALGLTALGVLLVRLRPGAFTAGLLCGLAFFELHTLRHHGSEARQLARLLDAGPQVARVTGIVWNEPAKPITWSRTITARFRLKIESLEIGGRQMPAHLLMNVAWAGPMPAYGDRVSLLGSAANLDVTRNPGQFDFAAYQQRQGVYSDIYARFPGDCRIVSHGHGWPAQAFAFQAARWIQGRLQHDLEDSPEISDLIASMVLGLRGETPEDLQALFKRTGTMHLLAVSGLHVGMLAAILLGGLRFLRVPRRAAVLFVIPLLAAYVLVTGLRPSGVRALLMLSAVLLGYVLDRRPLSLNSLGVAAFAILAWDTEQLFSPGFQFSFVLVIVITSLSGKIQARLARRGMPDAFLPRALWHWRQRTVAGGANLFAGALGVTISAWLGSVAFTAGYFHLFSPAALFANLIAVPIAFAMLVLGLTALLAAPVWQKGLVLCNNANWFCAKAMLSVLKLFALLPGGYLYVEIPRPGPAPVCELTVLDLGEGGATHLRAGACDWLLDCGGTADYDRIVLPYLRSRGVNQLDGLLLTHGDSRHLGGALPAIADFTPACLVESALGDRSPARRELHRALARRNHGKGIYERGDFLHPLDHATGRVLYPPAGIQRRTADDMALVIRLEAAGTRVLLMSDSGLLTEQWLLQNEPDLRSDLLIKGQHAQDPSGTPDFLARVQPQAVICSALGRNAPPEPLAAWARALTTQGIAVFRQDRTGAVRVEIGEEGFALRGYVNGQTFRSRAR